MTSVAMALFTLSISDSLPLLSLSFSSFFFLFSTEHLDNVALIDQFFFSCDHQTHTDKNFFLFSALYEFRVLESIDLGSVVGVIRAMDADIGENAEMDYRIIGSDGPGLFDISINRSTQEGVIVLRKVSESL